MAFVEKGDVQIFFCVVPLSHSADRCLIDTVDVLFIFVCLLRTLSEVIPKCCCLVLLQQYAGVLNTVAS